MTPGVAGEQCTVSVPEILTLSATGNSGGTTNPRFGTPFVNGLTGAGAIAGEWDDMTATPVDPGDPQNVEVCDTVQERIGGPGGVWLEHDGDIVPPAAPQLTSTDPASPNASGAPRVRGAAEAGSKVSIYAGPNCTGLPVAAGTAAELGSPGIPVGVAEGVTAAFSARATDIPGNTSACSAPIAYTRWATTEPPIVDPPESSPQCVVPKLAGKTLKRAKVALRKAHCKLGAVKKPKGLKAKKGKKRRVLVVKSSTPRRGAKPANGKVNLKLGPKPRKARR